MNLLSKVYKAVHDVYKYEQTASIDVGALQRIMATFGIVMLLIDMENLRQGEWLIGIATFVVAVICVLAALLLRRFEQVRTLCKITSIVLLFLSIPILFLGANAGFSLLWYFLIPLITLILLGIPFGAPICIGFGCAVMLMFWTPLRHYLLYSYRHDYYLFYPIFYWTFCLIVVIMDIFYKEYRIKQSENEKNLQAEVDKALLQTKNMLVGSVAAIGRMIDEKDSYTRRHSQRVAEYARLIASHLPNQTFSEEEMLLLYHCGMLHDIGKIAIPDHILNKPDPLTDQEYEIMKTHTLWGEEILSELEFLQQADLAATHHHERYDGKGYPQGLKADELPLSVHIICAADALDAMNSDRCYRKRCTKQYIIREFEKGAGKQFEPQVAATVVQLVKSGKIQTIGETDAKTETTAN